MNKLRWGILGTARIGRSVIPAIKASERCELVAVASRSKESASQYAEHWDIPKYFVGYEELLASDEVDAVYIPLPNRLHVEWTVAATRAGKHVLCEKPIALDSAGVDEIAEAASNAGVVVSEAFMYRHHPRTLRIKEAIERGDIGEVRSMQGAFAFFLNREGDIRLSSELGGGSLWDVGCYPLSFARFIAGAEPTQVFGHQRVGPSGVDMSFSGQLRFPNDVHAQIFSSFESARQMDFRISGSGGVIRIPEAYKPSESSTYILESGDVTQEVEVESLSLYRHEIEDFVDSVQKGAPPRVSLDESRGNVATIEALLQSAKIEAAVSLGEPG